MRIAPARIAAVKRGAGPNSPRLTADVSSVSTQPAPINKSACKVEVGSVTRCRRLTPRRISARVAAIGTPEDSRGTASMQPSTIGARASSSVRIITVMRQATHFYRSLLLLPACGEKGGMRGLKRVLRAAALKIAERPLTLACARPLPV